MLGVIKMVFIYWIGRITLMIIIVIITIIYKIIIFILYLFEY